MHIARTMARAAALFIFVAFPALTGCATQSHERGRSITNEKVAQVVKGQTTVDQVIEMFGAPTEKSQIAGRELYIYKHSIESGSSLFLPYFANGKGREQADELVITFDSSTERVVTYSVQRGIDK